MQEYTLFDFDSEMIMEAGCYKHNVRLQDQRFLRQLVDDCRTTSEADNL